MGCRLQRRLLLLQPTRAPKRAPPPIREPVSKIRGATFVYITMAANPTKTMSSHPRLQTFLTSNEVTNLFSLSYLSYPSSLLPHLCYHEPSQSNPVHDSISNHNGQGTKADMACEEKELIP
jgi:hypothetical protein